MEDVGFKSGFNVTASSFELPVKQSMRLPSDRRTPLQLDSSWGAICRFHNSNAGICSILG